MSERSEPPRRRRRRRPSAPARSRAAESAAPEPVGVPTPSRTGRAPREQGQRDVLTPGGTAESGPTGKRRRVARDPGEGGLRDLVGSGRSAVGVDGALRARDVNRPSDEDLAAAEREVEIVRRHWRPPPDKSS